MKKIGAKSFTHKHSSDECMGFLMEISGKAKITTSEPKIREQ